MNDTSSLAQGIHRLFPFIMTNAKVVGGAWDQTSIFLSFDEAAWKCNLLTNELSLCCSPI